MTQLFSIAEVKELLKREDFLILAGDRYLLEQLPVGNWIGGSIPYFMTIDGGVKNTDKIFVTNLSKIYKNINVKTYAINELETIGQNYFENGFSYVLVPAFSKIHTEFAQKCNNYKNIDNQPLFGWVAGFDLNNSMESVGYVFDGRIGKSFNNKMVVAHIEVQADYKVEMEYINLFKPGNGDNISFLADGFYIKNCFINGEITNFAKYIIENEVDTNLPLVTDYKDVKVNVSIKNVDRVNMTVELYAPVFEKLEYNFAAPIGIYEIEFNDEAKSRAVDPIVSCNCILNYIYANLEGKKTPGYEGPMTFGEIGNMLLNQTLIYLYIKK